VFFLVAGVFDSPHFMQLCWQSSRYCCSSCVRVSAAFLQSSLCSWHPASLQSFEMVWQDSFTSSLLNATRLLRISRHSSLASTHVRMYLNRLRVCSRSFCRLTSKSFFSGGCLV
jgi:hypothetical protein